MLCLTIYPLSSYLGSGYSSISKPRSFREKPHQFSFERQSEFIMPTDISVSTSIYVNIVTYMDENETFQYIYRRLSLVLCSSVSSSLFTTKTFVSLRGWTLLLLYAVGYGSGTEWKHGDHEPIRRALVNEFQVALPQVASDLEMPPCQPRRRDTVSGPRRERVLIPCRKKNIGWG